MERGMLVRGREHGRASEGGADPAKVTPSHNHAKFLAYRNMHFEMQFALIGSVITMPAC